MSALVNMGASLAFGASLSWVLRRSHFDQQRFLGWPLVFFGLYYALVATPICALLFQFYPNWSLHYWFDPQVFSGLANHLGFAAAGVVGANLLLGVLGFELVRRSLSRRDPWVVRMIWICAGTFVLGMFVSYSERILFVGEYDTYWRGRADFLFATPAGILSIFLFLSAVVYLFWLSGKFRGMPNT